MAQQYDLLHPNHLGFGFRKTTDPTEQSQLKCLNQPRHCAHYNSLRYWNQGSLQTFWPLGIQQVASSDIQTIQKPSGTIQKCTRTYSTTWTLPYPWKTGNTTHQWAIGWYNPPIQQHTSMQSIPWLPSYSLTTTTSILDPPWASATQHLQSWLASTCLIPNVLEPLRHACQTSRLL